MRPDAYGICLLKQTASGAQSVTSPLKIEGFREFGADLSALFFYRITVSQGLSSTYEQAHVDLDLLTLVSSLHFIWEVFYKLVNIINGCAYS